jgi:hypothetical protein
LLHQRRPQVQQAPLVLIFCSRLNSNLGVRQYRLPQPQRLYHPVLCHLSLSFSSQTRRRRVLPTRTANLILRFSGRIEINGGGRIGGGGGQLDRGVGGKEMEES